MKKMSVVQTLVFSLPARQRERGLRTGRHSAGHRAGAVGAVNKQHCEVKLR